MTSPRPGERRTRNVRLNGPSSAPQVPEIGPIVVTGIHLRKPGPTSTVLDVAVAGVSEPLAREIGHLWRARNNNGRITTAKVHREALMKLFQVLKSQMILRWGELTVEVLEDMERQFQRYKSGYDHAHIVWDYLRNVHETSPNGAMTAEVRKFLRAPVNVPASKKTPTEALPAGMLRDVLRAAMHDVSQAEYRIRNAGWDGVSSPPSAALIQRHETVAFFILLCMEWGQSPDVLKTLSFDPSQPTSVQDWGDSHVRVTVRWFKPRARGRGSVVVFLADKEWRAGSLLRRLRDATAATRSVAGEAWSQYPWICADEGSWTGGHLTAEVGFYTDPHDVRSSITGIFLGSKRPGFLRWCQRQRKAGLMIEMPDRYTRAIDRDILYFRSIRPAAKWARFVAMGKGLLLSELVDDNTIEVLSAHYLNSQVALRDIAEAWQEIPGLAEEVARGLRPTALNCDGKVVSGAPISAPLAQKASEGELSVGISGCRDALNSPLPGEKAGRVCTAANRGCFFCPNSVVTPDDIPAMKAYLLLAELAVTALSPPEWALHWGRTVRWITWVLPQMDPDWQSRPAGDLAQFDLGLGAGPA